MRSSGKAKKTRWGSKRVQLTPGGKSGSSRGNKNAVGCGAGVNKGYMIGVADNQQDEGPKSGEGGKRPFRGGSTRKPTQKINLVETSARGVSLKMWCFPHMPSKPADFP